MALFFDQAWFDRKLSEHGLTRADAARTLGLSEEETADLWKDQREVLPGDVKRLALLLDEPEEEVRRRAGIQGPPSALRARRHTEPPPAQERATETGLDRRLADIEARLARIEEMLVGLTKRSER